MLKLYIVKNGKSLQNGKYICPLHVIRPSMRIWQFENKYVILQANK
jgi:hypothetical protein